jgi:hypothetical protein
MAADRDLQHWQILLAEAEHHMARREATLGDVEWTAHELAVYAVERETLAEQREDLADAYDRRADQRDRNAEIRDVQASHRERDRSALADTHGFADRLLAAEDRDDAAGDRADSRDDRARAHADRHRAADARHRSAPTTDAAIRVGERAELALEALQRALTDRSTIGQATGLLMGRHNLTPERASAMLRALAEQRNEARAVVAQRLIAAASHAQLRDHHQDEPVTD